MCMVSEALRILGRMCVNSHKLKVWDEMHGFIFTRRHLVLVTLHMRFAISIEQGK